MIHFAIRTAIGFLANFDSKFPIKIIFANGKTYQNLPGTPQVTMIFRKRIAEWRTVIFNYVGFMESYFDGQIDLEGEDALPKLIRMSYEHTAKTTRDIKSPYTSARHVVGAP